MESHWFYKLNGCDFLPFLESEDFTIVIERSQNGERSSSNCGLVHIRNWKAEEGFEFLYNFGFDGDNEEHIVRISQN